MSLILTLVEVYPDFSNHNKYKISKKSKICLNLLYLTLTENKIYGGQRK